MISLDGVPIPDHMVRHFERSLDGDRIMIGVYGDSDSKVFARLGEIFVLGTVKSVRFGDVRYMGYMVVDHTDHTFGEKNEMYVKLERKK